MKIYAIFSCFSRLIVHSYLNKRIQYEYNVICLRACIEKLQIYLQDFRMRIQNKVIIFCIHLCICISYKL